MYMCTCTDIVAYTLMLYRTYCSCTCIVVVLLFHIVYQPLHSYSDISATGPDMVRNMYLHSQGFIWGGGGEGGRGGAFA